VAHDPAPHTPALPRRSDRRRARTRAALLEAGRALYALRGLEAVSVDEIVAAADVAKGSFYNHFRDKDGLAREIAGEVRRQAERLVEAANAGVVDPAARVARALCVFIRFAIDHRDSAQVLWRLNSGATLADAPANRSLRAEVERHRRRVLRADRCRQRRPADHGHGGHLPTPRARRARHHAACRPRPRHGGRPAARARHTGAHRDTRRGGRGGRSHRRRGAHGTLSSASPAGYRYVTAARARCGRLTKRGTP